MQVFSWASIGFYCLFGMFVFHQQFHLKSLQAADKQFALVLKVSSALGMLTGLAYLVFYAWSTVWWAALVVALLGAMTSMLGVAVARLIGQKPFSLLACVGWPVSAFFMFSFISRAA